MHAAAARNRPDVNVRRRRARHLQAAPDRALRETGDVLDAAEPLFLEGGDQLPVAEHGRGDVTVIRVETDNEHR